MQTFDRAVLPLAALLAAVAGGVLADRAAALRRPDGDRGDYWATVTRWSCLFLAVPAYLSGLLATLFPQLWRSGRHFQLDLTGVFGWSLPACYRIALLLPFVVWALLLLAALIGRPGGRAAGRWLAGAIGFGSHRLWVLVFAAPLAALALYMAPRLGGGLGAYPAVTWGTQLVVALSLVGVALSAGPRTAGPQPVAVTPGGGTPRALRAWPEALAAQGIRLRQLAAWQASAPPRAVKPAAADLAARLAALGAREVAPELIEAAGVLLGADAGTAEHGPTRIVFAPDDCGQTEVVALVATLLDQRFHATSLVVTVAGATALAQRLQRWLPAQMQATAVEQEGDLPADALVWVVTAQVLSDRLLPMLKDPLLVKRFGLVIWWHLEAYTGVLAANLWAISRRLHRLLQARGRQDLRTLVLARSVSHGGAQLAAFVRRLLPHPFPSSSEVHVEQRFPRAVQLHLLESHQALFARGAGRSIPERLRHLPLIAAKVSVEERWPTRLEPADLARAEIEAFLQLPATGVALADQLRPDNATAGVRLTAVEAGNALALVETICQGGRTAPDGLPHHVGVPSPTNPYVAYLLGQLAGRQEAAFPASRRLIAAEALPSVIRRQLLLALNELPDTREGLLKDFLWNEQVIRSTLDAIFHEGKLLREEVRFLGEGDRLKIDHEYTSQRLPSGEQRPLDTVGSWLIEVREPGGSYESGGVRMRLDPERLTIQAYPNRVFLHDGRRYRVREWGSVDSVLSNRWLPCDREEVYCRTWRLRNAQVFAVEPSQAPVGIGRSGKLLSRFAADLRYEEEVEGALWLAPDLANGQAPRLETRRMARPVTQSFATRGLVLRFPGREDPVALASLAQALRHVLPVHLGVEEDALEVVPLNGDNLHGIATFGLAVVDLYPGGIGLVDEVRDDSPLLLQLLEWTRDWLAACPCQNDQGCERCLRSPAALAANGDYLPLRGAALTLLGQMG